MAGELSTEEIEKRLAASEIAIMNSQNREKAIRNAQSQEVSAPGGTLYTFTMKNFYTTALIAVMLFINLYLISIGLFPKSALVRIILITILNLSMIKVFFLPPMIIYVAGKELVKVLASLRGIAEKGMDFVLKIIGERPTAEEEVQ